MKVALCISGHMRTFETCYPNLKSHIIDKYHPDIFISTWREQGFWSTHKIGFNTESETNFERVKELYNPISLDVEDYNSFELGFIKRSENFLGKLYQPWVRPVNVVSMWYKINKCNKLKTKHEKENNFKYDLVIRVRPDVMFDVDIPNITEEQICLYHNSGDRELIGDSFFMGSSKNVDIMCELYHNLEKLDCMFYAHFILKEWITRNFTHIHLFESNIFIYNTQRGYCVE